MTTKSKIKHVVVAHLLLFAALYFMITENWPIGLSLLVGAGFVAAPVIK